jgi:hypothetical protein
MNKVRAKLLCVRVHNFTAAKDNFYQLAGHGPWTDLQSAAEQLVKDLSLAIHQCEELGLDDCGLTLARIRHSMGRDKMDASRLQGESEHAYNAFVDSLNRLTYLFVPKDLCKYVDQDRLFGDKVWERFKDARQDVCQAGNCLAIECATASVFHLMRVAEHGLRAVAKKLQVKLTHKGENQPIEFADWNDVITGIRNKITEVRKLPRGPRKDKSLTFYSDVADQCEYMKDIWRNTIAHTRRPYTTPEAVAVFHRVETFMQRLASELGSAR